jgi:hypothetical protein
VLSRIKQYDAVLIDGDHNWYTVIKELRQIDRHSRKSGRLFPLTILHDIGWPYGRRDLYYNPSTIPKAFRHPYARKGMLPGVSRLVKEGLNANLCNATTENTVRNGVLTAIEDFIQETKGSLRLVQVPGFFGLGILFSRQLPEENKAFASFLDVWDLPEEVRQYVQQLESARVQRMGS